MLLHGVDRRCFLIDWFDILRCNAKRILSYVSSYLSFFFFFNMSFTLSSPYIDHTKYSVHHISIPNWVMHHSAWNPARPQSLIYALVTLRRTLLNPFQRPPIMWLEVLLTPYIFFFVFDFYGVSETSDSDRNIAGSHNLGHTRHIQIWTGWWLGNLYIADCLCSLDLSLRTCTMYLVTAYNIY